MDALTLVAEGDTEIVVKRRFAASLEAVYRAHIEPEMLKKWFLGPSGWTMPTCIVDARPGGKMRYDWSDGNGNGYYLTGEFIELVPFSRRVHVQRLHVPDPTPDNHIVTTFEPSDGATLVTLRITLPDAKTREMMIGSGMEDGMEESYARLEALIP